MDDRIVYVPKEFNFEQSKQDIIKCIQENKKDMANALVNLIPGMGIEIDEVFYDL